MEAPLVCNTLHIDTLRLIIRKKAINSLENLSNKKWVDLQKMDYQSKALIKQLKRKDYKGKTKSNKSTSIKLLKLNNQNHANSFLIAKTPQELNIQSNYKKCELSINGLAQINQTTKDTYKQLYQAFGNRKLSTIDLCIDLKAIIPQIQALKAYCNSKYIYSLKSSIYLNKPRLKGVQRIIIYDKANKHNLNTQWLRVEFTCKVDTKLKDYTPPYNEIYEFVSEVFNESFTIEGYARQVKLLADGRSYNKRTLRKKPNKIRPRSKTRQAVSWKTKEELAIKNFEILKAQKIAKVKRLAKEFKEQELSIKNKLTKSGYNYSEDLKKIEELKNGRGQNYRYGDSTGGRPDIPAGLDYRWLDKQRQDIQAQANAIRAEWEVRTRETKTGNPQTTTEELNILADSTM